MSVLPAAEDGKIARAGLWAVRAVPQWPVKVWRDRSPVSREEVMVYGSCASWHHSLVYSVLVIKFYRWII